MLTNEQLEEMAKRFYSRYREYNTKVIKKIAERIKEVGTLTPSDINRLNIIAEATLDVSELENELANITGITKKELYKIFEEVAKDNIYFAEKYYKYRGLEVPSVHTMRIVASMSYLVGQQLENMSHTTAFSYIGADGLVKYTPFRDMYIKTIDKAIQTTSLGLESYNTTMRDTLKTIAQSGVRAVDYASGYSRRLDSAVRMNILEGINQVNLGVQEQIGEEIGADGYEISVHDACAPDHLHIQGKQYTKKKYEELNSSLVRPIGKLNCRHFAFPIIIGVDEPVHSDKQLSNIVESNQKTIQYEGKSYTKYEATQVQRQLETRMRKAKDEWVMFNNSGDRQGMIEAQNKVTLLKNKYIKFSNTMDIQPKLNRTTVSGYKH